ncbi:MAG: helicase-exonuclease AddAB subunit AddA, partial [Clostridia bacterium]|nr:helicase-exonuclease AddAB subunit AddA [Clostridia bacterium]
MDGNTWTKAQKDAIKAKGGSVLVSAAAGSGKTAVLVQRVIEILTDKKNVCEANRLLIVTFTKAAAAEMRERINRRLAELIEQNPGDTFLKRQQILLSSAHISTIHSFCSSLIKDNFYKLDIPKEFRIADSSEIALLREDAINEVFEENYKASRGAFLHLIEIFNNDKNDKKLVEIINSLYDFIRSYPFPKKWLDEKLQMYDSSLPAEKSAFGQIILNYAESLLCYCSDALISAKTLISKEEKLSAYLTSFEQDLSAIQQIKDSLKSESWDDIAEKINNFTMSTLKRITGEHDNPVKLKVLSIRKQIKSTLLELQGLFAEKASDCIDDTKRLFPIVKELFCIVRDFYEKLEELKRKSSICDFGDLEHLSIKLLVSPSQSDFERTEVAKELSEKFKYIMIDECQDINAAQDMIFKAISKDEANLFTVGDVKQSIYRFRQAMPEIFLDRKERYKKYDEKAAEYPAKIILDRNFRSRKEILDMVNFIFRKIMSREIGEMEYTKEEELRLGAVFEDNSQDSTVELKVLDLSTKYDDENLDAAEARYISAQIYKMITQGYKVKDKDGFRAVTFRDFCILLRNTNKHTQIFAKEMLACGIPTIYDNTGGFFSTNEVSVITSLLNVIDNPVQDVPLISVLLSPIAGFSVDDLAFLRAQSPDLPLYFAFLEYSKINERAKLFLDKLKKWRALAATMRSDKLINYIYADSGYINTVQAMPLGQIRLNNLRLLAEYARNFEANERKGLGSFVVFINRLKEQKFDLNAASSFSKLDNAVRIMSIHKSKGLEFPVCFIANCS